MIYKPPEFLIFLLNDPAGQKLSPSHETLRETVGSCRSRPLRAQGGQDVSLQGPWTGAAAGATRARCLITRLRHLCLMRHLWSLYGPPLSGIAKDPLRKEGTRGGCVFGIPLLSFFLVVVVVIVVVIEITANGRLLTKLPVPSPAHTPELPTRIDGYPVGSAAFMNERRRLLDYDCDNRSADASVMTTSGPLPRREGTGQRGIRWEQGQGQFLLIRRVTASSSPSRVSSNMGKISRMT